MGKWIDVKEKLPYPGQLVDVFVKWTLVGVSTEPYHRRITDVRYDNGAWFLSSWERVEEEVTHWMELPEAPTGRAK